MRRLLIWVLAAALLFGAPVASLAQYSAGTGQPSIGQVLVREGDYAVRLSKALGVSQTDNEAEAESHLASLGIAPTGGWISDYPVTPDIIGQLQVSIESASTAGRLLPTGKDEAVRAFVTLNTSMGLNITPASSYASDQSNAPDQGYAGSDQGYDQGYADQSAPAYPDQGAQDTYYDQAPPVVTYYAPPPDYAYLYNWDPFPFFWGGVFFPGFFVLADFSIGLFYNPFFYDRDEFAFYRDHDDFHHGHHGEFGEHNEFVSNHFSDHGRVSRFEEGTRFGGHEAGFGGRHEAGFGGRHEASAGFNRESASRIVSRDISRGGFGRAREGAVRSSEGQVRRSWSGSSMPSRTSRFSGASPGFNRGSGQTRSFQRPSVTTGRSFGGGSFRSAPSARSFDSGSRSFNASHGFFGGGSSRSFSAPSMGSRSFNSSHGFFGGGRSFGGSSHGFSGGGSRSFNASHGFMGGGSRSFGGGGHSFGGFGGGGHSFGGGHGFGGGGHFGGFGGGGHRGR